MFLTFLGSLLFFYNVRIWRNTSNFLYLKNISRDKFRSDNIWCQETDMLLLVHESAPKHLLKYLQAWDITRDSFCYGKKWKPKLTNVLFHYHLYWNWLYTFQWAVVILPNPIIAFAFQHPQLLRILASHFSHIPLSSHPVVLSNNRVITSNYCNIKKKVLLLRWLNMVRTLMHAKY